MDARVRRANTFEVILLIVGIGIGIIGFSMINRLFLIEGGLSWGMLTNAFLWLMLIVLLILSATMVDVKEELAMVIKEHIEETRLLKDLQHDQLKEIKLLRNQMNK